MIPFAPLRQLHSGDYAMLVFATSPSAFFAAVEAPAVKDREDHPVPYRSFANGG